MPTTHNCSITRTSTTITPTVIRDRDTLLRLLDVIDTEARTGRGHGPLVARSARARHWWRRQVRSGMPIRELAA